MKTENIFKDTAPRYWAKGLPAIPLQVKEKRPIVTGWQSFAECMPSPSQQSYWLSNNPHSNIGLPMGRQAGLVAIDIDTLNEDIIKLIQDICGPSPWVRIGAKGMVMVYKWNGHRTARIQTPEGGSIVEILSGGTQIVIPPSIHPSTKAPYTANVDLIDVLDQIPALHADIENLLRNALRAEGFDIGSTGFSKMSDWVSQGSRDTKMTQMAGFMAHCVTRGEMPLVEAFDRMQAWWDTCQEKVVGDEVSCDKGKDKVVEFLCRDVLGEKKVTLPRGWDDGLTDEAKKILNLNFDVDVTEWDYEQLKEYAKAEFKAHGPDTVGRHNSIQYILDRIVRSPGLNRLEVDTMLNWMASTTPNVNISSLRGTIKDMQQGQILGMDHTELAQAVVEEMEQYGEMRYWADNFYQWGGSHWEIRREHEIMKVIVEKFGSGFMASKKRSDHKGIMQTMAVLLPQELRAATVTADGVNFANGFLTKDLELVPHDPTCGMTYTLPFRYMPEDSGKAFRFSAFLQQSWQGDEDLDDKIKALQEALCVTLFGMGPKFQRAILLHGVAKTGKSVMLDIASSLVPPEARSVVSPTEWGDKFLPELLAGRILNIAGELSGDKFIDGEVFKKIVVGEEMTVQKKNGQPYQMRPEAMHWFGSNHLPKTKDNSSAFNRRWVVITFNHIVPKAQRDLDIAVKIVSEEREAIVAWALEAMPRLLENREYTLPASHETMMRDVANNNNSTRYFMTESGSVLVRDPGSEEKTSARISEQDLFIAYSTFCLGPAGARPVGIRTFRSRMRELSVEMGFTMHEVDNGMGGSNVEYDSLILVRKRGQ